MTGQSPPRSPKGLQGGGRALWRDTIAEYQLATHELVLLEQAARVVDALDALRAVIVRDGAVVSWGEGLRANPALVESRQQQIVLARLLASLAIPAENDDHHTGRGAARGTYKMRAVK